MFYGCFDLKTLILNRKNDDVENQVQFLIKQINYRNIIILIILILIFEFQK